MREIIKIEKVRHEYEDGRVTALREVSFAIEEGEYVAIVGPSGSGKSTLLHLLGALETPTSGRIEIDGQNLCEVRDLNDFRAKTIGFIFQSFHLLPHSPPFWLGRWHSRPLQSELWTAQNLKKPSFS